MLEPLVESLDDPVRVTVVIGSKTWGGGAPNRVYLARFGLPQREARYVRDEVQRLVYGKPVVYTITEKAGRYNWGSDNGPFLTVALYVAEKMGDELIGTAVGLLLGRLLALQREHASEPEDWHGARLLTSAEAIERARWLIEHKYPEVAEAFEPIDGHADGLELESEVENRADGSWTVCLRNAAGWRYRVVIGLVEGLPEMLMMERHAPGPHQPSSD